MTYASIPAAALLCFAAHAHNLEIEIENCGRDLARAATLGVPANDSKELKIMRRRDLAGARGHELQALVDYRPAVTEIEEAMNRLAAEHQIVRARRN